MSRSLLFYRYILNIDGNQRVVLAKILYKSMLQVSVARKVDIRLPGKGNSNSRGARPVYSFR